MFKIMDDSAKWNSWSCVTEQQNSEYEEKGRGTSRKYIQQIWVLRCHQIQYSAAVWFVNLKVSALYGAATYTFEADSVD